MKVVVRVNLLKGLTAISATVDYTPIDLTAQSIVRIHQIQTYIEYI